MRTTLLLGGGVKGGVPPPPAAPRARAPHVAARTHNAKASGARNGARWGVGGADLRLCGRCDLTTYQVTRCGAATLTQNGVRVGPTTLAPTPIPHPRCRYSSTPRTFPLDKLGVWVQSAPMTPTKRNTAMAQSPGGRILAAMLSTLSAHIRYAEVAR